LALTSMWSLPPTRRRNKYGFVLRASDRGRLYIEAAPGILPRLCRPVHAVEAGGGTVLPDRRKTDGAYRSLRRRQHTVVSIEVGCHIAWLDGVDPDAKRFEVLREGDGDSVQRGLR
jgi:hypothetical protein